MKGSNQKICGTTEAKLGSGLGNKQARVILRSLAHAHPINFEQLRVRGENYVPTVATSW